MRAIHLINIRPFLTDVGHRSPLKKYDGTNGIAAFVCHWFVNNLLSLSPSDSSCSTFTNSTDESYKAAGYIPEHLIDPATTFADAPESSPMMLAVGYRKAENSMWTWFEQPSNEMRLRRFGMAMNGVVNLEPPYDILTGMSPSTASLPGHALITSRF